MKQFTLLTLLFFQFNLFAATQPRLTPLQQRAALALLAERGVQPQNPKYIWRDLTTEEQAQIQSEDFQQQLLLASIVQRPLSSSDRIQLPPVATQRIDEVVLALANQIPSGEQENFKSQLRMILTRLAARTESLTLDSTWRGGNNESLNLRLWALSRILVSYLAKALDAKASGQNEQEAIALQVIVRTIIEADLLVGMGNSGPFPHFLASMAVSTVAYFAAFFASVLPIVAGADPQAFLPNLPLLLVTVGGTPALITHWFWNLGATRGNALPRFYPRFIKNLINLLLNRRTVDSYFWKFVARDLKQRGETDVRLAEFLTQWVPNYTSNVLWRTDRRDLRRLNTTLTDRFLTTLAATFESPMTCDFLLESTQPKALL